MSNQPKLFISFSGKDQQKVRELISALILQDIEEIWDYSDEGQEISAAESITSSLAKKIDDCDYFIAVISPNSIDEQIGRFTRFEVNYAISCQKHTERKLLPLLLDNPSLEWLNIYPELSDIKGVDVDPANQHQFEEAIRQICSWLQVTHQNLAINDPRVFFAKYFNLEIGNIELKNSVFIKLRNFMNQCAKTVLDEVSNKISEDKLFEKWNEALDFITAFLQYAKLHAPTVQFYYPLILKGVFQLYTYSPEKTRHRLDEAEQTFSEVINRLNFINDLYQYEESSLKECIDAKSLLGFGFAGLAHTYYLMERFDEAFNNFEKAAKLLPDDKDIDFNRIGSMLLSGNISQDLIFNPPDFSNVSRRDWLKIISIKGFYHYKKGEFETAVEIFQNLAPEELDEIATIYYFLALEELHEDHQATQVLSRSASRLKTPKLYHYLADKFMRMGYLEDASDIFEEVLCQREFRTRRFAIDYARTLKVLGDKKKMSEICRLILDSKNFEQTRFTDEDFYYRGFANYLLGEEKLAKFDYESSNHFGKYYSELETDNLTTVNWFSRFIQFIGFAQK